MAGVRIGMAQILVEGGALNANLSRAVEAIRQAKSEGCQVVVLPECLDTGWTDPSARTLSEPIPGTTSDRLCEASRLNHIYVVAGITERAGDRLYNASILIDPTGEILLKHRKIGELDIALDLYTAGSSLEVCKTALGVVGISICADNAPANLALGHELGKMGCTLLLSPCAWAVDADHDNEADPYGDMWRESYSELAHSYGMTIVGLSNIGPITAGPWAGRKCIGSSLMVSPTLTFQAPYDQEAFAVLETGNPQTTTDHP